MKEDVWVGCLRKSPSLMPAADARPSMADRMTDACMRLAKELVVVVVVVVMVVVVVVVVVVVEV